MAQIDGIWDTEAKSPIGIEKTTLTLATGPGGTLTGSSVSVKDGTVHELAEGRVDGDTLRYQVAVTKPMKLTLKFEVKVDGDTLEGVASAGFLGKATLKGVRRA